MSVPIINKIDTAHGSIFVAKNRVLVKTNEPEKSIGGIELAVVEESETDRSTGEVLAVGSGWDGTIFSAGDKIVFSSSMPITVNGEQYSVVNFEDILLVLKS